MLVSTQRPAIETLIPHCNPVVVQPDERYYLDGREVFLLGISSGSGMRESGTTAMIAVFGLRNAATPAKMPDVRCSGAVLLGRLGELDQQPEPFFDNKVCLTALEAVKEISEVEGRRVFKRLGKTAQYVNLI